MRSIVVDVLGGFIAWLPWMGLLMAVGFICFGIMAMDDEGDAARDAFLLAIATALVTGCLIALVMVQ